MRLSRILPPLKSLRQFCREYSDRMAGENNDDMKTNGEWNFLKEHAGQCQTVFDVGAHKGEWTDLVLGLNPSAVVHCFEPIQAMFGLLQGRNFPGRVFLNHQGLSSENGERDIYLGVQSLYPRIGLKTGWGVTSPGKTEKVELITLDDYCKENRIPRIDLLKCDVEGHEYFVFQGAQGMIGAENILRIQFEYGGCNIDSRVLLKDIFEQVRGLNYSFYMIMRRGLEKIDEYDQRLENFAYKNFVLLHHSIEMRRQVDESTPRGAAVGSR